MKFTQRITLYSVNSDNTVTFVVLDDQGQSQYYRANARFDLLVELSKLEKNTELTFVFGVYYQRGKGLALQIVEVK